MDFNDELLSDHQMFHSEFQIDYMITGKSSAGTIYGAYKQALRELKKRGVALDIETQERRLMRIKIAELSVVRWLCILWPFLFVKLGVKILQQKTNLREIERSIRDTKREFDRFEYQRNILKEKLGDISDPETRNKLDRELWFARGLEMMAVDYMSMGAISPKTYDYVLALPPEWWPRMFNSIGCPDSAIKYIEARKRALPDDCNFIPEPVGGYDVPNRAAIEEHSDERRTNPLNGRICTTAAGHKL